VDRLNHLVDQLLLLARFENQKQSLKLEPVYLNGIFLDAIARQTLFIESKEITISQSFNEDVYCKTDSYLVSIIINNLVSNALKYSNDKGTINIQLLTTNNQIECVISNTGIGIPEADLDKIFHPFFRSNAAKHQDIKGIGLGLSIVQRLCSLLSIDLKISSKEAIGTKVSLIFKANA
jgi:signal transduction histidine kinase